jgi:hypothetical protein
LWNFARSDTPAELGALKKFKMPSDERNAEKVTLGRLRNVISILNQGKPGLVKLLDANEQDRWIVTGYIKNGSLDRHPGKYRGDAKRSLKAFRSLVETVARYLHQAIPTKPLEENGSLISLRLESLRTALSHTTGESNGTV